MQRPETVQQQKSTEKHPEGEITELEQLALSIALKMAHRRKKRKRVAPRCTNATVDRLIKMKVKCNFSVDQLKEIISLFEPTEAKFIEKLVRKELRQNYSAYRLHGCAQCEEFVWIAGERRPCDICNNQDGRSVQATFTSQ